MKRVIQLDENDYFVGVTTADPSPLEPGVYLYLAGTVDAPLPPEIDDDEVARWDGQQWIIEPDYVLPPEPELISLDAMRNRAWLKRADFKLALLDMGYLPQVKQLVSEIDDERIQILWADSDIFTRNHPDLLRLASQIGVSDAELDAIFGIQS